jgi:hypothetical protein
VVQVKVNCKFQTEQLKHCKGMQVSHRIEQVFSFLVCCSMLFERFLFDGAVRINNISINGLIIIIIIIYYY